MYYTIRFIDGLRPDIRATVLVQRPSTLDTACSLALLQEEVASPARPRDPCRPEAGFQWKPPPPRTPLPLPAPPRIDKQPSSALAAPEAGSPIVSDKPAADKFAALKAYRRARGLCDRCAERWRPGHKCAPSVQLHVVQELIDLLQVSNLDADLSPPHTEAVSDHGGSLAEGQLFVALFAEALAGSDGPHTMHFEGTILDIPLLILVDSGSSHSFLSFAVAAQLPGVQKLSDAISVQVANVNVMLCSTHLPAAVWKIQNYHFSSDPRILPLQHFDLILGMDWLESFSPMKVHWKLKWLSIPYQNSTILL